MFQIVFQNGRFQNLAADSWNRDHETVHFKMDGKETQSFPACELIMIDDLESGDPHFEENDETQTPGGN